MNVLNKMVMVRLVYFVVMFYGNCCVDCAINIPPADHHHVNNIISKEEVNKNTTLPEIALDGPPQIVIIQPEPTQNTRNEMTEKNQSAEIKTPLMISIPFGHNKKVLTSIVHPLPRTMHDMMPREPSRPTPLDHKKVHDDFLKHEVPKLQKRLHHHYTVEELRQKRKELKEKWQARHNKLSHLTPHGLHDKNDHHLKATSAKLLEKNRAMDIQDGVSNSPAQTAARKESLAGDNPENIKINIADMYEQVTPRTRRILEHKEEEEQESSHLLETKHRFSVKAQPRRTSPTPLPINEYTKPILPETQPEVLQLNSAKRSIPPEGPPKSSIEHTTESQFNLANINLYPIMPDPQIAPVYFWPTATSEYTPHSNSNSHTESSSSTKPTDSTSSRQTLQNPAEKSTTESSKYWLDPIALLNRDEAFEFHSGARSVADRLTTDVPAPSKDDVVSVKIDNSGTEVFTIRIDTPPYYRNMTEEEAFLYQKPVFNYGKAAEEVGNSIDVHPGIANEQLDTAPSDTSLASSEEVGDVIDVHPGIENEQVTIPIDTPPYYRNLTYDEKILIQKPIFLGKSAEEVGDSIDVHSGIEHNQETVPIDTHPHNKSLTYGKKILIQKPFFRGKSSEEVGDSNDVHSGIEIDQDSEPLDITSYVINQTHKKKIQKPLLHGKSSEEKGDSEDIKPGIKNQQVTIPIGTSPHHKNLAQEEKIHMQKPIILGESAEQFRTTQKSANNEKNVNGTTKNTSSEISEEAQMNQDWKEHLREAVKERLRKFRRDSAEVRLL